MCRFAFTLCSSFLNFDSKSSHLLCREHEFSYKDGAFAYVHKPCRFKEGYRPKFDVLLTSYEFVSQDMATLNSIEWSVLVIDEAHRLKSQQSLVGLGF